MNRDKMGRYARSFFWVLVSGICRWLRRLAVVCAFGWVFFAGYTWSEMDHKRTVYAASFDSDVVIQGLNVEALKDGIVERLIKCESGGAEGLIVFDQNSRGTLTRKNVASIGVLQFKVGTVQSYWKELHGNSLSEQEAVLLALDTSRAKNLAKEIIFRTQGGIHNWTCANERIITEVEILKEWLK